MVFMFAIVFLTFIAGVTLKRWDKRNKGSRLHLGVDFIW